MLPKELAVAEAWLLAMLFVERARAFMIFPTFVLITSRSALKSPFQVVAAISIRTRTPPGALHPMLAGSCNVPFTPNRCLRGLGMGGVGSAPGPRDGRFRTRTASAPRRASASERWRAP